MEKVKLFFDTERGFYRTFYKGVEIPFTSKHTINHGAPLEQSVTATIDFLVDIVNEKPEEEEIISTLCGSMKRNKITGEVSV